MLIFEEGGKPENSEKKPRSKDENQQQTQPTYDAGSGNRTRDTLVGGDWAVVFDLLSFYFSSLAD